MEKELNIIIAGCTNSGKSSLMFHLQQLLLKEGFTVEVDLKSHPEYDDELDFHTEMQRNTEERLAAIKKRTTITLNEMQLEREAYQDNNTKVKG